MLEIHSQPVIIPRVKDPLSPGERLSQHGEAGRGGSQADKGASESAWEHQGRLHRGGEGGVGLSLRLEGWVGERASRQMVLSGPKTQRVEEHSVCLGVQARIGDGGRGWKGP